MFNRYFSLIHDGSDADELATLIKAVSDAVAMILSKECTKAFLKEGAAIQWLMDAFGHLKAIGFSAAAQPLLDKAGVVPDEGVKPIGNGFVEAARTRYCAREPDIRTQA